MTIILRPSQPWPHCPGQPGLIEKLRQEGRIPEREPDSEVAALGTRAHFFAECKIKATFYPEGERAYWLEKAEEAADLLPENFLENASKYVRAVTDILFGRHDVIQWGVETKVPIWYEPQHKGTVDFWHMEGDTLHVLDYKSGRVEVKPEHNTQLISYALGLMDARGFTPSKVKMGILQPFVGGFRGHEPVWWEAGVEEMRGYREQLGFLAQEARSPLVRSRLIPGEKQCRFCPAKPLCPAVEAEAQTVMGLMVDGLTDSQLFEVMARAKVVRDFLDGVEDRVRDMPETQLAANGWRLKKGARKFSWARPEAEIVSELRKLGIEPLKTALKTPSMVRDEMGDDKELEGLYQVDFNRPTLTRVK